MNLQDKRSKTCRWYMHREAIEKLNDVLKHLDWHELRVEAEYIAKLVRALNGVPWINGAATEAKW